MPSISNKPPIGEVEGKKEQIEEMFDSIAPKYDLLNRVLSVGIDKLWRKRATQLIKETSPSIVLDVATGTADLAIEIAKRTEAQIVGVDISQKMLDFGQVKIEDKSLANRIVLEKGDSENLKYEDQKFDAATVSFGVRNFENLERGLSEISRVLRKDGKLVVLEFSRPRAFPMKQIFNFYFKNILPRIGKTISKNDAAYEYLPESVRQFPEGEDFLEILGNSGFRNVGQERLTFGIATIYTGSSC